MNKGAIDALVGNVIRLMADRGDTQATVAGRGGISQRSVGYVVTYGKTHHTSPTLRTVDGLAKAFDVPAWALLVPDLPLDLLSNPRLSALVEHYRDASDEIRSAVDRIAELGGRHGNAQGSRKAS